MPTIYTTKQNDTLNNIIKDYYDLRQDQENIAIAHIAQLNQCLADGTLPPNKLLMLPDQADLGSCGAIDYQALRLQQEMSAQEKDVLNRLLNRFDGDTILAIGDLLNEFNAQNEAKAVFGGALSIATTQGANLTKAIDDYNSSLKKWVEANGRERRLADRQIDRAFNRLQTEFKNVVNQLAGHKRNSSNTRYMKRKHSAKAWAKKYGHRAVDLKNSTEIQSLRTLTKSAKFLGTGALVFDMGLSSKRVLNTYQQGGNTTRVAMEELGGIFAGLGAVYLTTMALMFIPGVGIIVAMAAGGYAALKGAEIGKEFGSNLYSYLHEIDVESKLCPGKICSMGSVIPY